MRNEEIEPASGTFRRGMKHFRRPSRKNGKDRLKRIWVCRLAYFLTLPTIALKEEVMSSASGCSLMKDSM